MSPDIRTADDASAADFGSDDAITAPSGHACERTSSAENPVDTTRPHQSGAGRPRVPIDIIQPGYVDLSDDDRCQAVAALSDIMATWWQRHHDDEPESL